MKEIPKGLTVTGPPIFSETVDGIELCAVPHKGWVNGYIRIPE